YREAPFGRMVDELQSCRDGETASDLASGHPTHSVGDEHRVTIVAVIHGDWFFGDVGREDLMLAADLGYQEMVFVLDPDLAGVGDGGEVETDCCRRRFQFAGVESRRRDCELVFGRFHVHRKCHCQKAPSLSRAYAGRIERLYSILLLRGRARSGTGL